MIKYQLIERKKRRKKTSKIGYILRYVELAAPAPQKQTLKVNRKVPTNDVPFTILSFNWAFGRSATLGSPNRTAGLANKNHLSLTWCLARVSDLGHDLRRG